MCGPGYLKVSVDYSLIPPCGPLAMGGGGGLHNFSADFNHQMQSRQYRSKTNKPQVHFKFTPPSNTVQNQCKDNVLEKSKYFKIKLPPKIFLPIIPPLQKQWAADITYLYT